MSNATRVVLVSKSGYQPKHNQLLNQLIARKIKLFCAVGKDCERWEDVMDELCERYDDESVGMDVTTSSHPGESIEDVIEFAKLLKLESDNGEIEIIEI